MWTRKAAFTFTGGCAGLDRDDDFNQQMMILGLSLIAFIVVNSWISDGDVEVQRTLSADNLYKGDDLYVELPLPIAAIEKPRCSTSTITSRTEMKLRSGLNQMQLNLRPGERKTRIRYVFDVHCEDTTPSVLFRYVPATCSTSVLRRWSPPQRHRHLPSNQRHRRGLPAESHTQDVHRIPPPSEPRSRL